MTNTPNIREEIQNEIRFLTLTKKVSLDDHPIINYYGCKFTKEKIYIAMELASCDLATFWLTQVAHAEPENKFLLGITIIVYVLRALTFLEKLNIIHGDIKPQNLVVVPRNECFYVKLIDFGTVEKMNTLRAQISVDATKAHTVFFASPEFLKRDSNNVMARHLHKKSDAWAAGVMFYILFFDRLPWRDQFEYENFCNDSTARDVVVPRQGGYKAIIELLLKKNPEKRSSAKATLMQMKGHPALRNIIESLHEDFCPVDDVCHMRVSDDVRNELGKNNTIFIQDNY
jgi:serine/threonine protein kinase